MAHRAETLRSIHRAMSECLLSAGSPRIASLPLEGNAIKLSKILIAHASNSVCFFMPFSSQLTIK